MNLNNPVLSLDIELERSLKMNRYPLKQIYIDLFFTLVLAFLISFICYSFDQVIRFSDQLRFLYPWVVLLLPGVFLLTKIINQRAFYYPKKIKDLTEINQSSLSIWNSLMTFYHFILASLSHLFGASVGREGVIVQCSTGLVLIFQKWGVDLKVQRWAPVAAGISFSAITGQAWVGVVFIAEMFRTEVLIKIYTLIGALVTLKILDIINFKHLFELLESQNIHFESGSFLGRGLFIIALGFSSGFLANVFKSLYLYIGSFRNNKSLKIDFAYFGFSIILSILLFSSYFNTFQSLGLEQLGYYLKIALNLNTDLNSPQIFDLNQEFIWIIVKLLMTLFCVSIGFYGGEFVPLVVVGSGLGLILGVILGENTLFAMLAGSYSIFAGVTRLKWTSLFLSIGFLPFTNIIWIYLLMTIVLKVSNHQSLYKEESFSP